MRTARYLALVGLIVLTASCDMDVTNVDNPDRPRILASPSEVEALAGAQFQQIVNAAFGNFNSVHLMMATASFMNTSGLANTGMGPKSSIPRAPIDNSVGNSESVENYRDFRVLSGVARNAADILAAMGSEGGEIPYLGAGRAADDARLRALTHFLAGVSYGYISLIYDSSGIARFDDPEGFEPPLEGYAEVNAFALEQFGEALRHASTMSALPADWLKGPGASGTISRDEFIRIVRSYRAHMRADVARTPAERESVVNGTWADIISDAAAGIEDDYVVQMNPAGGWQVNWFQTTTGHFRDSNWHQMGYYIIGMADVSGGYADWLAAQRDIRPYFLIVTPDERLPQGTTRAEQVTGDVPLEGRQYVRNRPPERDEGTTGWRSSMYDHYRFRGFADAGRVGPFPWYTLAQNDMLRAEGYIRTGNPGNAVPLINRTRNLSGLPDVTVQGTQGQSDCVPRFPPGAPGLTHPDGCGNLMLAMMWETWMETAWTSYGAWFFVNRGWGVMPVGTAFHWPVPHQELDARQLPIYNAGGSGLPGGAGASVFGFGENGR